jgi:hypothetical protein
MVKNNVVMGDDWDNNGKLWVMGVCWDNNG